jgi:Mg-chelatase subunit ChlI
MSGETYRERERERERERKRKVEKPAMAGREQCCVTARTGREKEEDEDDDEDEDEDDEDEDDDDEDEDDDDEEGRKEGREDEKAGGFFLVFPTLLLKKAELVR